MVTATSPLADPPLTKGELTRRTILDAAVARFGRDGFRATSVADIAREAGVGGTVPYAYFADKEALFLAAVDDDAAGVIEAGLDEAFAPSRLAEWRDTLLPSLLAAVDHHPLAHRLLAGLEPEVTERVLETPALAELRKRVRRPAARRAGRSAPCAPTSTRWPWPTASSPSCCRC